jgi:hypothetical protein
VRPVIDQKHILDKRLSAATSQSRVGTTHQKGIETHLGYTIVKVATPISQEVLHRQRILILLYQNLRRIFVPRPLLCALAQAIRLGERDPGTPLGEIRAEPIKIVRLDAKVQLGLHHLAKDGNLFRKGDPLHPREQVDHVGEDRHDGDIATDRLVDARMEDFDGDLGMGLAQIVGICCFLRDCGRQEFRFEVRSVYLFRLVQHGQGVTITECFYAPVQ